ncbi:MAG: hypothetical protein JXM69_15890, partial [Anaerolineae bacterium]|nr:hypothetical protein [Anaerolineae bacterium]
MTAPSSSPEAKLPLRLRHFTDREAALAAFDAFWPGDGACWVLAFDGLSGNGKSTLIDYLIETRCKPRGIIWAVLDFEGSRGLTLRTDWSALLDTLAGQWQVLAHPLYLQERDAARQRYETVRQTQTQTTIQVEQQATRQGRISESPININLGGQSEAVRQANEQARHDTAEALLRAVVAAAKARPLLLFLDTYELLAEMADKEYEGWLWAWLARAAGQLPALRVFVASRRPLTGTGLSRRDYLQHGLPVFDPPDSDCLLAKLGVDDPAWRAAVYQRLAGGHPLLTEMAADLWREAQASGQPLPVEAISRLAGQEEAVRWLVGRILDRLDNPIKSAVRWAALLRRFDQELLAEVLPGDAGRLTDDDYQHLCDYSFVAPARLGSGRACHNLLRRVQNAYLSANKPQAWRNFQARAAACFAAAPDGELEALYHRLMAGDETAPRAWYERVHAAYLRLDWPGWSALLEIAESPELAAPPSLQADACFWRGQWHRWRYDNMTLALASYNQALELFRAVQDRLGEANTLQAIG